jgi:hypothetical protein
MHTASCLPTQEGGSCMAARYIDRPQYMLVSASLDTLSTVPLYMLIYICLSVTLSLIIELVPTVHMYVQ